jgi:CBS domain-containing protein
MVQLAMKRPDWDYTDNVIQPWGLSLAARNNGVSEHFQPSVVAEVMQRDLIAIGPGATALDAKRIMRTNGISHLLVRLPHDVMGILCTCDLRLVEPASKASSIASTRLITIDLRASLRAAANLMRTTSVGCLPVVNKDRLVGVLTRGDLHRCGFPTTATGPLCATCGSHHHVRKGSSHRIAADARFCLECADRMTLPVNDPHFDLGGEG